ncbi:unnamed protein product [Bursaphelenchus xylophilus]|uniref:(pine wood nematode) hypothetical protein n=1 Tax=Bursaphelenchus xylophilus TaxID=6326 RepID=A0A1I7SX14_BURXY|nr:unnamed protein product [Bursaphelenchus xylophilus]CAG9100108.1 unnamed protein product [Bursaphelenchus xylophilus]
MAEQDEVIVLDDDEEDGVGRKPKTDWISRLPYEEEVMLDAFLDDVVFITARGLGMERLFLNHLHLYSDPAFSVLVLNTESEDQHFYIEKLKSLNPMAPPRLLTADVLIKDRELIYKGGGVQFVTSRILMVDLLTDKVPLDRIAGILVYKAHHALTTFQDTFILRLFREKKPDGFVKCFTDIPTAITSGGMGQLQRLVNRLYVKKVRILPRFEESIKRDFDNASPDFIEMSIDLPANQRRIRSSLVDIIGTCIRELKQCTQGLDIEVDAETVSSSAALRPTALEMELRSKSLLLTDRQERLLNDLRILRRTLKTFEDLDPASVHKILYFYKSNQEYIENNSGWLNTPTASKIFLGIDALCCAKTTTGDVLMIPPPKWSALSDALKEIKEKLKSTDNKVHSAPVLVFCSSEATCRQLIDVCKFGVQKMAWLQTQVYYNELHRPFKTPEPAEEPLWSTTNLAYYDDQVLEKDKRDLIEEVKKVQKAQTRSKRRKLSAKLDVPDPKQPKLVNFGLIRHAEKLKEKRPKKVEVGGVLWAKLWSQN